MKTSTLLLLAAVVLVVVSSSSSASTTPDVSPGNPRDNNTKGKEQDVAPQDVYMQLLKRGEELVAAMITAGKQTSAGR